MATTAPSPPRQQNSRRTSPSTAPTPLARAASARAAASPRMASFAPPAAPRRPTTKSASPPTNNSPDSHEALSASLKHETDQKEQLLVQLEEKDQLVKNYVTENNNLTSALTAAETRLHEFYAEQSRWETDLGQRIEIADKLREQVRELEKEKRDLQRRYNEQMKTFDAERQAFYDNEQHLKSRIQSLSQARKRAESLTSPILDKPIDPIPEFEEPPPPSPAPKPEPERPSSKLDFNDPDNEPAEMTSLRLELSTLSTSYSSLQSTLILMQSQLVDLKRVNQELQEENESFMILLREKTLSGQFDISRQMAVSETSDDNEDAFTDGGSLKSRSRSVLDRVEEEPDSLVSELQGSLQSELAGEDDPFSSTKANRNRKRSTSHAGPGESLAGLPITGPGLDLAAELGRAENKDILDGDGVDDQRAPTSSGKRRKTISQSESSGLETSASTSEVDALRTEVKSLKDANKALSLYASKIIDRIIAQEGFEHVLAADYDKEPTTPATAIPRSAPALPTPPPQASKARPQSVIVGRSTSIQSAPDAKAPPTASPLKPSQKAQRRSLSFDWKGFSLFSEKKPDPPANLRPLTLKPGSASVVAARKLDTEEDEDDRRERERVHATLKLMGIQPTTPLPPPSPSIMERSITAPTPATPTTTTTKSNNRRFSFFGSSTKTTSTPAESSAGDSHSIHSNSSSLGHLERTHNGRPQGLTQDALERAEAENTLAALDARERDLSLEIAKGASGGFTEITPRTSRRKHRRSEGGSGSGGSTVWSAGMSAEGAD